MGTGPPDEVQEMLTLPPSEIVMVVFIPAKVIGVANRIELALYQCYVIIMFLYRLYLN